MWYDSRKRGRVELLEKGHLYPMNETAAEAAAGPKAPRPGKRWIRGFRIGTDWMELEITTEPYVVMSFRGFAPVVGAKNLVTGESNFLYISPMSLANKLEKATAERAGKFAGIKLKLRKESELNVSPYEVEFLS